MIAVQLTELSKKYGRRIGISGIDLTVNEGDIFGLIGPDGAGKTTILRILMNYIYPSDGEAEVFDMDVTEEPAAVKKDTVYVPGEVYFYPRMKGGKYLSMTLRAHRRKKSKYVKQLVQDFELDLKEKFDLMDRSDQKKLALVAAIASEPRLLLLDEPLRGLDASEKEHLFSCLRDLNTNGTTILVTGRDADELQPICNKITVIENGEITVTAEQFDDDNPGYSNDRFVTYGLDEAELASADTAEIPGQEQPAAAAEETIAIIPPATEEAPQEQETAAEEPAAVTAKIFPGEENELEIVTTKDFPEAPAGKTISMKSMGFNREAFKEIGAKVVSEENNKIVIEYGGDIDVLAKLLYDLNMDDIRISCSELREAFLPFYEGGEDE